MDLVKEAGMQIFAVLFQILDLKMGYEFNERLDISKTTSLSHFISELMNVEPDNRAPFVGISSFAHKGGIHVVLF